MLSHNVPLSRALESRWDFLRKLLRSRRKYALNCSLNVAPNDVISVSLKEKRARGTEEERNHLRFYCASFGLVIRCSPPQRNVINAIKKRKYLCKTTFLARVIKNSNCHSVIDEACRCQVATACAFRQKLFASFFIIIAIQREARRAEAKHTTLRVIEKEKISKEGKLMWFTVAEAEILVCDESFCANYALLFGFVVGALSIKNCFEETRKSS